MNAHAFDTAKIRRALSKSLVFRFLNNALLYQVPSTQVDDILERHAWAAARYCQTGSTPAAAGDSHRT
jgi:hypothetical protein